MDPLPHPSTRVGTFQGPDPWRLGRRRSNLSYHNGPGLSPSLQVISHPPSQSRSSVPVRKGPATLTLVMTGLRFRVFGSGRPHVTAEVLRTDLL